LFKDLGTPLASHRDPASSSLAVLALAGDDARPLACHPRNPRLTETKVRNDLDHQVGQVDRLPVLVRAVVGVGRERPVDGTWHFEPE
jgi:hypothetical protein